jgi:hypothetical protein
VINALYGAIVITDIAAPRMMMIEVFKFVSFSRNEQTAPKPLCGF